MIERRKSSHFVENLSIGILTLSALGALLVLIDPIATIALPAGSSLHLGGSGFSDQLKGMVVATILVGGFSGVIGYWIGASSQGNKAQESVNSIAQLAAPSTVAAVAAAATDKLP